tara:strand:+ start:43667 stop:44032 length:366 start_codon:yes stop_codon:yes gene_type:complete
MTIFDVIKNISASKDTVNFEEDDYNTHVVNKSFSLFVDTVLYANEMNMRPDLSANKNYAFMFNSVRKRKRFSKWPKNKATKDEELVSKIYKYNQHKTKQVMKLLKEDDLQVLRDLYEEGGE